MTSKNQLQEIMSKIERSYRIELQEHYFVKLDFHGQTFTKTFFNKAGLKKFFQKVKTKSVRVTSRSIYVS